MKNSETGFGLLEMLIAMVIFLVIAGGIIGVLAHSQKAYRSSEIRVSLEQNMRAALELMSQEVAQAGLQPSGVDTDGLGLPLTTVVGSSCTSTCIASGNNVVVPVTTVSGLYVGEWVRIDVDPTNTCSNCEVQQIETINTSVSPPQLTFYTMANNHSAQTINGTTYGTPIYGMGTYPQGVLPPGTTASGGSTQTQLELFGDLNGAGNSLLMAVYQCPSSSGGSFTRTVYTIGPNAVTQVGQTVNLIDNVTSCQFTYPCTMSGTSCQVSTLPKISGTAANKPAYVKPCDGNTGEDIPLITSVGVTITAQSNMLDAQTGKQISITKSYLNIQPRNILAALNETSVLPDGSSISNAAVELQPIPTLGATGSAGCQVLP